MPTLPPRFASLILTFACLFHQRTWLYAQQLLLGAILAPGIRTVSRVLRLLGRADDRHFVNFHRVLNRAPWSPRAASRVLLGLLLAALVPAGPLVFGLDDTLERRSGRRIRAKGVFHDSVRSRGATHRVNTPGLRWLSVMLLAPVPWAQRVWALPVLTVLAPNARTHAARGVRHKSLTDWARQLLHQVARWCAVLAPARTRVVVADATFATLDLLAALAPTWTCITRVRLDIALYAPAPPRRPGTRGAPRKKGSRLPSLATVLHDAATRWQPVTVPGWYGATTRGVEVTTGTAVWYRSGKPGVPIRWVLVRDPSGTFDPQALLTTDQALPPRAMLQYFVRRWQVEVTFAEARRHLGLETQRQWSDRAIARTTPVLLSLFSLVTLCATQLAAANRLPVSRTAWYPKRLPTFSDALAAVRRECWAWMDFSPSVRTADRRKIPIKIYRQLIEPVLYAA